MTDETRRDREGDAFAAFLRRHRDAYNPPPETPVEAIWEGIRESRSGDDALGEFLRRHGDAYNAPPGTPVEAIWEGVRRSRDDERGRGRVVPITWRRWLLPALAAAAVLLLGIALGRISLREAAERGPGAPAVATRAEAPTSDRPAEGAATGARNAPPDDPGVPAGRGTPGVPAVADATPEAAPDRRPARRVERPQAPPAAEPRPARPARATDLYRLASVQMLAQAEMLLVDYRSGRAAGREDAAEIGRWARDVLASTRMLLDSRAADDPRMRALLEDLELVLAQIVHHTGADPIEGEMIDRAIEERDLIPRLRTAIPAGGGASI